MSNIKFSELEEFTREFKKLLKKYHSLEGDIKDLKKLIKLFPNWYWNSIVRISDLWKDIEIPIFKVRKFAVKSLRDSKSISVIYAYNEKTNTAEFVEIEFVEIFHKNKKDNHDTDRIKKYYWKK